MKGRDDRAAHTTQPDLTTQPSDAAPPPADATDALPLQSPRLLTKTQAAAYCAITPDTFDDYRRRGIVPDPITGTNRWDRKHIDIWLDKASGIASTTQSSLDEWRARHDG